MPYISLGNIVSLQYRGKSLHGSMTILLHDGTTRKNPYAQNCVQRCFLCPDGTVEWADISVCDPWYVASPEESDGNSLIIIRKDFVEEIFDNAIQNGYVVANKVSPKALYQAQLSLVVKRKANWPRLFGWKLLAKKLQN